MIYVSFVQHNRNIKHPNYDLSWPKKPQKLQWKNNNNNFKSYIDLHIICSATSAVSITGSSKILFLDAFWGAGHKSVGKKKQIYLKSYEVFFSYFGF